MNLLFDFSLFGTISLNQFNLCHYQSKKAPPPKQVPDPFVLFKFAGRINVRGHLCGYAGHLIEVFVLPAVLLERWLRVDQYFKKE